MIGCLSLGNRTYASLPYAYTHALVRTSTVSKQGWVQGAVHTRTSYLTVLVVISQLPRYGKYVTLDPPPDVDVKMCFCMCDDGYSNSLPD